MPTPDQTRLETDRASPRIMQLWWALQPLKSVIRFMQSGAHPDDEHSGMLAALAFREGFGISYACSTRGEGGQNDIGTEAGTDLGALRTREMERACDVLGMRMYWHSETSDDAITDFGFSKSGVETLGVWGHDRTLSRFVEIVRTERPDILCPTFLDVPGQHGHHRAMTQAAHEVMAAAADPAFPSNLPPWQVGKLYLPATSGAGTAYDDDEPPPPATLVVDGAGGDPVSGWSWARIGQQSRAFHRTQGMGRWVPSGDGEDWKLHLAESHLAGPDETLSDGLPRDLAALGEVAPEIAHDLRAAQQAIGAALTAFPDGAAVARSAKDALKAVRAAREGCPAEAAEAVLHRLAAKEAQLSRVIRLALGIEARAYVDQVYLRPGEDTGVTVEVDPGEAEVAAEVLLPQAWSVADGRLSIGPDARSSDPYCAFYDPSGAEPPCLEIATRFEGVEVIERLPFESPPVVLPARSVKIEPEAAVLNLARPERSIAVALREVVPDGAAAEIAVARGWTVNDGAVTAPDDVTEGLYSFPIRVEGATASVVRRIEHSHVAPTAMVREARLTVRALSVELPEVRVGYVGAGNDRVDHWLGAIGADVTSLTDADLAGGDFSRFDSIVIGIFAMRFRAGLAEAMPRLHRWCEAGGTLVTLYHRPWDNWDPDATPPRRLEIGQPSLRWRVTDQAAEVTHLAEHDLLSRPNRIGPEDWAGWVKERGLYFAKDWAEDYVPLLEMADPDEAPHRGSLLVADVGEGRHVHTSLILHHQMEHLVPGAFRLMANLIARRR